MSRAQAIALGLTALAIVVTWTAAASFLFLLFGGLLAVYPDPWSRYTAWWLYALSGRASEIKIYLGTSGTLPAIPLALLITGIIKLWWRNRRQRLTPPPGGGLRPMEPGVTDNHGHAAWMKMEEARRTFPGPIGMVVGEDYRPDLRRDGPFDPRNRKTWAKGGTADLLIDTCEIGPTSSLEFCSPGSGKTSEAITRLLHWPGSAVVLDVASEIGPMLTRDREEHGHRVVTIGFQPGDDGIDALAWIDPDRPGAVRRVLSMTAAICGEEPNRAHDAIFESAGRNIVACLLAAMIWNPGLSRERKNLVTLVVGISTPQDRLRILLCGIHETSDSSLARLLAGTLLGLPDETFGGAYFNATTFCSWLFDEENAALLSGKIQPSDLLNGGITVFVQTPIDSLTHTPGLGRVIIDAFVSAAIQADGRYQQRMLFLLDEAFRLGPMKSLEVARDQGRKFGITMSLLYQSEGQLVEQWGKEAKSKWFEAVSWRSYSSIQDLDTAKAISAGVGQCAVLAYSEGDNTGKSKPWGIAMGSRSKGSNVSKHEISRDLIRPEEVLHDMRSDQKIVFHRFGRPLMCGKALWWRRPDLLHRVDDNRFNRIAAE